MSILWGGGSYFVNVEVVCLKTILSLIYNIVLLICVLLIGSYLSRDIFCPLLHAQKGMSMDLANGPITGKYITQ